MRELHSVVVRHLKTKRESEGAIELWNKLWAALEKGGDGRHRKAGGKISTA